MSVAYILMVMEFNYFIIQSYKIKKRQPLLRFLLFNIC
ncbi:hypothetical protein P20439_3580 [Pseudoalteromonas sp. BSi20439]|nr:hypothetical protein P20439_3580 [Pseudoalteromonas sp. BSi20439]